MQQTDTRDIAIGADVKIDTHVQDCVRFRQQIADAARRTDVKIDDLGDKIVGLQLKAALALGGLIAASKLLDYAILWFHK